MFGKYPSLFLLVFIVPSIAIASALALPAWGLFGAAVVASVAGFVVQRRFDARASAVCFGLAIGLLAGAHYSVKYVSVGPTHLTHVVPHPERMHIFGVVSDWPEIKSDMTEITLTIDSLGDMQGINRPVMGGILLKVTDTSTALQRGDRVEFFGRIYPLQWQGSDDRLDYRRRLHHRGISAIVYLPTLLDVRIDRRCAWGVFGVADRVHDAIVDAIRQDLPPQTGALAAGFLIGETRGIPLDVYQRFRDSGTLHVLAVSGGNVALVCLFVILLLRPFGTVGRTRSIILLVVIVLFAWVCYAEPSVVRASVMAILVVVARMLQRKIDLHNIIALTAVIILLYDPAQLFDVGAQLSFAAAWGLILFMPHMATLFEPVQHRWWYRFGIFPVLVSLVAQLCSTPLIAYYFGKVPMLSVVANLIVVPVAAAATLGTLAMLTAHLFLPILGTFVGGLLHPLLAALLYCMEVLGGRLFPQVDFTGLLSDSTAAAAILSVYIVIALMAWSLRYKPARRLLIFAIAVFANVALIITAARASTSQGLSLHADSVPGGVAVVVNRPGQKADMVVTGIIERAYPVDERVLSPLVKERRVDRIGRLFVLSADYGALDDLWRFAMTFQAETLLVDSRLAGSLREIAGPQVSPGTPVVREFGGHVNWDRQKIAADERGVWFPLDAEAVLISRSSVDTTYPVMPTIWIYGRTWRPEPDDWAAYRRAGIRRIISAKIEQALPEDETIRVADLVLPETIADLSRTGPVTIPLGR